MKAKTITMLIGLLTLVMWVVLSVGEKGVFDQKKSTVFTDHDIVTITIDDTQFQRVEIANTPASIEQGLSGRDELGTDGMLFVLGREYVPSFWMKDMRFDLDFVWIRDMRVIDVTERVSAPPLGTSVDELKQYQPAGPVDMVLELPSGGIDTFDIQINDILFFP